MIINKKARQYCLASVKIVQFVTSAGHMSNPFENELLKINELAEYFDVA
ncbi:hypothetical protein [Aquimarina longa]|nr:hypothetical protein [Aquimarina longa]